MLYSRSLLVFCFIYSSLYFLILKSYQFAFRMSPPDSLGSVFGTESVIVQWLSRVQLSATHGLQPARLPCPSLSPWVCPSLSPSGPLSWGCHLTISSSVTPFSSFPQSFPASVSFPRSWLFTSGGQSIGVSASASVLPMNIQGWFPLGLTGLISLLSKELSSVFSNTTVQKHQFFGAQPSL